MGKVVSVMASVEILAPPSTVRSIFFDFGRYPEWQQGWDIKPKNAPKTPLGLEVGDHLRVNMQGMVFNPIIEENSTDLFTWSGSAYGLFEGKHSFYFKPSEENPGGTTFVQREEFRGPLTFFFRPWAGKDHTSKNWESFNADLKKEAEKPSPLAV